MRGLWYRCVATLVIAIALSNTTASAGPQDLLALMQRITALAKDGRYGEALALARKLESEAERSTGRQSPVTAMTLVVLAQTLQAQGETAEADGDVVLVDSTRPVTFLNEEYAQWLSLHLPRQSLTSHLGVEPQGASVGRCGTRTCSAGTCSRRRRRPR